ncbi:MAG TPA: hypothetical protein VFR14_07235 [Candidatus Limnocylindrales bacterium]|nr:hypothetical protein [Candidatus Limnocylindrales bacterium]
MQSTEATGHPFARLLALAAATSLIVTAAASSALAAPEGGPPGNNGTVKIHEGPGEPAAEVRNEPHVCTFHLHFFFADPVQAGSWEIQEWAQGDKGTRVLAGTYDTAGDGEDRDPDVGVYELPDGHYKLFWDGDLDTGKHDKHKVFWVDCDEQDGGVAGETSSPPSSGAPSSGAPSSGAPSSGGSVEGGVLGETFVPSGAEVAAGGVGVTEATNAGPTLPPTDAEAPTAGASRTGWQGLLLGLAALLTVLAFTLPAGPVRGAGSPLDPSRTDG